MSGGSSDSEIDLVLDDLDAPAAATNINAFAGTASSADDPLATLSLEVSDEDCIGDPAKFSSDANDLIAFTLDDAEDSDEIVGVEHKGLIGEKYQPDVQSDAESDLCEDDLQAFNFGGVIRPVGNDEKHTSSLGCGSTNAKDSFKAPTLVQNVERSRSPSPPLNVERSRSQSPPATSTFAGAPTLVQNVQRSRSPSPPATASSTGAPTLVQNVERSRTPSPPATASVTGAPTLVQYAERSRSPSPPAMASFMGAPTLVQQNVGSSRSASPAAPMAQDIRDESTWACTTCTLINPASNPECMACGAKRFAVAQRGAATFQQMSTLPVTAQAAVAPRQPSPPPARATPPGSGLLAMMESAVTSVERFEREGRLEPEVAGSEKFDDDPEATQFAMGSAAKLLTKNANNQPYSEMNSKPRGRIVARTDVFDVALKGESAISSKGKPALAKARFDEANHAQSEPLLPVPVLGVGGAGSLSSLRKAYDTSKPGLTTSNIIKNNSTLNARPPEVTAEESPRQDSSRSGEQGYQHADEERGLEDEWNEIAARTEEIRIKEIGEAGKMKARNEDILSKPISYREVQQWLFNLDVDPDALLPLREREVDETKCGCMSWRRPECDVPGLDRKLWKDKDLVLFLKLTEFDFNETTHFRMLKTMHSKLTRNKVCPSIGRHWEVMGFQNTDPRTDLNRSGGVLNVIHLFFFFSQYFELLKAAYLLSIDDTQNFPIACVSINITRMVIASLLSGRLSSLCNSGEHGVFDTTCKVYAGGLFHFYSRWRNLKRTIKDTEQTFNEVRALIETKPARLIDALQKGAKEQHAKTDANRFEFTDLNFGTARAPQQAQTGNNSAPGNAQVPKGNVPKRLRNYHSQEFGDAV